MNPVTITPVSCFGVKGLTYRRTQILGNALIFSAEDATEIGRKQALSQVTKHRLQCVQGGCLWWLRLSFVQHAGAARLLPPQDHGPLEGLNNKIKTMKQQDYGPAIWNTSSSGSPTSTTPGTRWPDEPFFRPFAIILQ